MTQFLLEHGADPNYHNKTYRYALYNAASRNLAIVNLLLQHGTDISLSDGDVFDAAIWGGEPILSRLLEEPMTPPHRARYLNRALQTAAHYAKHTLCAWLLEQGAEINYSGGRWGSPLQAALSNAQIYQAAEVNNCILVVEMFMARGAGVNAHDLEGELPTPLMHALNRGSTRLVGILLAAKADVNICGGEFHSPLQCAARFCPSMLGELLARGARVNVTGGSKFGSPLYAAAYAHDAEAVALLLEHGADVNALAGKYGTALQAAAKWDSVSTGSWTAGRESVRTMEVLVAAGADVNAVGGKYGSALQMAAKSGNLEGLKWLLVEGDVNAKGGKWGSVKAAALGKKQWNVLSYLWRLYGKD